MDDVLQVSLRVLFAAMVQSTPNAADVAVLTQAHPKLALIADAGELAERITLVEIKKRKWRWGTEPPVIQIGSTPSTRLT